MNYNYKRQDYPAQCFNVKHYDSFSQQQHNNVAIDSFHVLIVTRQLTQPLHFDSAINLCFSIQGKGALNVDLLSIEQEGNHIAEWQKLKTENQISSSKLIYLRREKKVLKSPIADELEDSYHFDAWLKKSGGQYDVIITLESLEILYYPLLTRKTSIDHLTKKFIVFSRSSLYFNLVKSSQPLLKPSLLNRFYAERQVIELSDSFISNSQHYLNWMEEYEVKGLSKSIYCHDLPYFFFKDDIKETNTNDKKISHYLFVFAESSETEITLCVEAIKRLGQSALPCKFIIPLKLPRKLKRYLQSLVIDFEIEIIQSACEKINWSEYLLKDTCVVIPNAELINPVVLALIYASSDNFLTNSYDEQSNAIRTFIYNPEIIKEYLQSMLSNKNIAALKIQNFESCWVKLIHSVISNADTLVSEAPSSRLQPLKVSVCITHYNRGEMLLRAIASIKKQTYPCYEIIVVDDGSNDQMSIQVLSDLEKDETKYKFKVVRQNNLFIGAARNAGAAVASGDYILFMDDDNEAMPHELAVFAQVAIATDADILTCFSRVFSGVAPESSEIPRQDALFVGPNQSAGLVSNPYGDANMFVKLEPILKVGGFSQYYKVGRDDHEFLSRALLNGMSVELVPKALYNYRLSKNRIRNSHINSYSGLSRVMQSYTQHLDVSQAQQLRYTQGVSYAVGPWGVNYIVSEFKLRLIELVRIYVARFPILYGIARLIKGRKD